MDNFENYFDLLDNFNNNLKEEEEDSETEDCCMKVNIIYDVLTNNYVCNNCGIIQGRELEPLYENTPTLINPSDIIKGSIIGNGQGEFSSYYLRKTAMFIRSEDCYKSTTLYKSYEEIEKLMKDLEITETEYIDNVKYLYKQIYLYEDDVNTRYKIKVGLYIYCIISVIFDCNIKYDILNIFNKLKEIKIDIKHYNKAVSKLPNEYDKYFLNINMKETIKLLKDIKIDLSQKDIILKYNYYISKKMKINRNSILKGCVYNLIKNSIGIEQGFMKLYVNTFNTTYNTLHKFLELSKSY